MSAPLPSPSHLPRELIDTIIDEAQYDISTLVSLRSASRDCDRARIHLYRAIDLSKRSRAIQFFQFCAVDGEIKSYVRSIYVDTSSTPDYTDFRHILQGLTEVQELTISGEYECIPPVLRDVFMTYNLTALTLEDMEFDYADLQAFVRPYPTLRRLSTFEVEVEEQVAPNAAENGQCSLESLFLSQTDFFTRASQGIGHGVPFILADIRRLVLMNTMTSLNDLQQMLNVVHQPLEELYIYEPLILRGGGSFPALDLTKISTLTLEIAVASEGPGALKWTTQHFASRPVDKVCTTEINFMLTFPEGWHDASVQADIRRIQFQGAWDTLAALLAKHLKSKVERVRIIMSNQDSMERSGFLVMARGLNESWLQYARRRLTAAGGKSIKVGAIFREVETQPILPRSNGTYAWEKLA
ncbi:hypothetical protein IW261DRAFT_841597 [Armillaria novae-zelandiae]|uniref:Uncharacterized protein n=1 Tax=Armillaria novae-zelandiae TaxID=153914 RepID=A0AA39PHU9_9AGAR|nr:hypothetical protein IW261DRAFT_841597 [Armillaria novae-zelandiae]